MVRNPLSVVRGPSGFEALVADVAKHRAEVIARMLEFAEADMLMFWGMDKDLVARQEKVWRPILDWAEAHLAVKPNISRGLEIPKHSEGNGRRLRAFMESLPDAELAAFFRASTLLKSLILGAAFVRRAFPIDEIARAAFLEEEFQEESWGSKEDVRASVLEAERELEEIKRFLG